MVEKDKKVSKIFFTIFFWGVWKRAKKKRKFMYADTIDSLINNLFVVRLKIKIDVIELIKFLLLIIIMIIKQRPSINNKNKGHYPRRRPLLIKFFSNV